MASAAVASAIPAPHTVPDGRSSRSNSNEVAFAPTDDIKRIADVNESLLKEIDEINTQRLPGAKEDSEDYEPNLTIPRPVVDEIRQYFAADEGTLNNHYFELTSGGDWEKKDGPSFTLWQHDVSDESSAEDAMELDRPDFVEGICERKGGTKLLEAVFDDPRNSEKASALKQALNNEIKRAAKKHDRQDVILPLEFIRSQFMAYVQAGFMLKHVSETSQDPKERQVALGLKQHQETLKNGWNEFVRSKGYPYEWQHSFAQKGQHVAQSWDPRDRCDEPITDAKLEQAMNIGPFSDEEIGQAVADHKNGKKISHRQVMEFREFKQGSHASPGDPGVTQSDPTASSMTDPVDPAVSQSAPAVSSTTNPVNPAVSQSEPTASSAINPADPATSRQHGDVAMEEAGSDAESRPAAERATMTGVQNSTEFPDAVQVLSRAGYIQDTCDGVIVQRKIEGFKKAGKGNTLLLRMNEEDKEPLAKCSMVAARPYGDALNIYRELAERREIKPEKDVKVLAGKKLTHFHCTLVATRLHSEASVNHPETIICGRFSGENGGPEHTYIRSTLKSVFGEESVRSYLLQLWPEVFREQVVSVTTRSERTRRIKNPASTEITGVHDASAPTISDKSDGFVVPDSLPDATKNLKEDIKRMVKEEIDHRLLDINAKLDLIMEKLNGSK
ncbi:hypothetical protein KC333_g8371 [Hortaea werneckii]|nr:hypothetical protein KC333_g8371 [Hortaea werneckii]KAI7308143.1 hypothetical protein KC326_g7468 [Hortaea werneckii]